MRRPVTTTLSRIDSDSAATRRLSTSRRIGLGLLATLIGWTTTAAGAEEPSAVDEAFPRASWWLYGNPEIGIYGHSAKGSSSSTNITGPRVANPKSDYGDLGVEISAPERSRERVMSALPGATFGALTPALDVTGRPRLFMEVNISFPVTTETQYARRGNPGTITLPDNTDSAATPIGEGVLNGVGTQLSVQQQGPQVHAGFGASAEMPLAGNQLIRIKPGLMYSRTILDIKGQTIRAVRLNNQFGVNQDLSDYRFISLRDDRTEVYHSIGPSIELEYLPGIQWGPLNLSFYGRAHAAYSLTGLKTQMESCNVAGGQPDECARWKYVQDPWAYRFTAGVHLNWIPKRF